MSKLLEVEPLTPNLIVEDMCFKKYEMKQFEAMEVEIMDCLSYQVHFVHHLDFLLTY